MTWLWLVASIAALAVGEPEQPPGPDSHAIMAYEYIRRVPSEDRRYIRFLSYYNYSGRKELTTRVKSMRFWVNQLHFERAPSFAREVSGSGGLLFAIDLREFGWNSAAFSAVARREPYFREPFVDSATSILLRKYAGVDQDPRSLHVEAVVRADWFFRETMESDRSASYYDLLFAKQRFKRVREVAEGRTELVPDGYGRYVQRTIPGNVKFVSKFVKFPKNEADFERIFAVDKFREHLGDFKIDTRHGAVVEGMEKGVSIVARQNRLIERIQTSVGSYYKTFDVKETAGKRDFAETLNKDFEFDAGEILADLPGGGMAALLVDSKGNIVEVADNRFAADTSDLRYDARVRTPGSCFICHEQKYITPKNLVPEMLKAGIDIKFRDPREAVDAKGFFLDWEDKMDSEQSRFVKFIARTSGMKAGENASALKAWRDEYDAPVDRAAAARESGLTAEQFQALAAKSTRARIGMLGRGLTIPRRTWEIDGYREIQLLLNASKK
jgi:hypothetical protein